MYSDHLFFFNPVAQHSQTQCARLCCAASHHSSHSQVTRGTLSLARQHGLPPQGSPNRPGLLPHFVHFYCTTLITLSWRLPPSSPPRRTVPSISSHVLRHVPRRCSPRRSSPTRRARRGLARGRGTAPQCDDGVILVTGATTS